MPLNMLLTEREISFSLEDSDAVAVVFNDRLGRQDYIKIMNNLFPGAFQTGEPGRVTVSSRFPKIRNLICFSPMGESYPGFLSFNSLYDLAAFVQDEGKIQKYKLVEYAKQLLKENDQTDSD